MHRMGMHVEFVRHPGGGGRGRPALAVEGKMPSTPGTSGDRK